MTVFAVYDPVTVTPSDDNSEDPLLEGAVAYVPPADGGDGLYGIRLSGKSVGKGNTNGNGKFECPVDCGLFVPASRLQSRNWANKLEELKVKREIRTAAAAATAVAGSEAAEGSTTTTTTSATKTPAKPSSTPTTSSSSSAAPPPTSTRSKLDEIRLKRAALQKEREIVTPPKSSPKSKPVIEETNATATIALQQQQQEELESTKASLQAQVTRVSQLEDQVAQLQTSLQQQQASTDATAGLHAEIARLQTETTRLQTALTAAEAVQQQQQPTPQQKVNYKERAALQAQLATAQSQLERAALDKLELQNTLEESTVDFEFLQARHEELQDKYEEVMLDNQANQLALEECQLELEEQKAAILGEGGNNNNNNDDDTTDALRQHNIRLRSALVKLREQTGATQLAHQREVRTLQSAAAAAATAAAAAATQQSNQLQEQIDDLKTMVEQGAAYESMVEDLSDRVLVLEDDNTQLRTVIRELEDAAELTAEMEEVSGEELRALNLELQGRDSMIQNLEEAIRMQRRREDDFKRTVAKYKHSVETMQQEKQALMGMFDHQTVQENASQKALAKAAQWVADAARTRRHQAQAVVDAVAARQWSHVAARIEVLLPPAATAPEVSAIKGELLTATVLSKVARVVNGMEEMFLKGIRPQVPDVQQQQPVDTAALTVAAATTSNDDRSQRIKTMFHQVDFCNLLLDASADWMRCLLAGQWPDLLSSEKSTELGSAMGHAVLEFDLAVSHVLRMLKEEGELSFDQSNIGDLQLAVSTSLQNLRGEMERKEGPLVPTDWNPLSLHVFKFATRAKVSSMAAAASLAVAMEDDEQSCGALYNKLEQCSSQTANACARLAQLDIQNEKLVVELSTMFQDLATETESICASVKEFVGGKPVYNDCVKATDAVLRRLMKLLPVLRAEKLNTDNNEVRHALSPQSMDPWTGIVSLTRAIRSVDGDPDDTNAQLRSRNVEERLSTALDKEPQLELALAKVGSLEKTLLSRSKEISMQNARMIELEKLAAKSNSSPMGRSANKAMDFISSDEYKSLKEENKVLNEAMEVMQRDVEMYETEIRQLKDFKSPGKRIRTPQRGAAANAPQENTNALEATLFRPALQQALAETSRWQASKMADIMDSLPPLPKPIELPADPLMATQRAFRLHLSSARLIDLTAPEEPREQLRKMQMDHAAAIDRLQSTMMQVL